MLSLLFVISDAVRAVDQMRTSEILPLMKRPMVSRPMVRGSELLFVLQAPLKASVPLTYIRSVVPSKLAAKWVQVFHRVFITLSAFT